MSERQERGGEYKRFHVLLDVRLYLLLCDVADREETSVAQLLNAAVREKYGLSGTTS